MAATNCGSDADKSHEGLPETNELIPDPTIGREAARNLDRDRAEVREDELACTRLLEGLAVLATVGVRAGLAPDAESVRDESVELVSNFIALRRIEQAQVNRGVSAVGDDREQYIVTGLRRSVAFLDRGDALIQQALVRLEGRGRLRGDDLALAAADTRDLHKPAQVLWQHHVRERAEHGDQLRDVDELREARSSGGSASQMQGLRAKLESAQHKFESSLADVDQELVRVSSEWDAALDSAADEAARKKVMERMNEVLNRRSYIRNLVNSVRQELVTGD